MTWRSYIAVGAVAALLGAFGWTAKVAYDAGRNAEKIEAAARVEDLESRLAAVHSANRAAARQIEAMREARATLAREIEDEIRADSGAAACVPSPDSLLRFQRRWGAP